LEIIRDKIFMLALLILFGYIAEKTGYVKNISESISKVITKITLPLLVITTLSSQGFDTYTARGAGIAAGMALTVIIILLVLGYVVSRLMKLDKKRGDVHACLSAFGNVMFLGYPLIGAVFGERGIFYAAFYALVNDLVLWTAGVLFISRQSKSGIDWKKLVNPNSLSFAVGLIMYFFNLKIEGPAGDAASVAAAATTPLSMFFIGSTLAAVRLRNFHKNLASIGVAVQKMMIAPLLAYFILAGLSSVFHLGAEEMVIPVIILQAAMPCQTVFAIIAAEYNSDKEYAAVCIFVTTLLSLLTLPIVYSLISYI
jgi:predicted permease